MNVVVTLSWWLIPLACAIAAGGFVIASARAPGDYFAGMWQAVIAAAFMFAALISLIVGLVR